MKREEILSLCASTPEVVAYIESLESQIKELSERLQGSEARLNQNSRNSSKPPSTDFSIREKPNPKSRRKRVEKDLGVKKVTPERLLIWLTMFCEVYEG